MDINDDKNIYWYALLITRYRLANTLYSRIVHMVCISLYFFVVRCQSILPIFFWIYFTGTGAIIWLPQCQWRKPGILAHASWFLIQPQQNYVHMWRDILLNAERPVSSISWFVTVNPVRMMSSCRAQTSRWKWGCPRHHVNWGTRERPCGGSEKKWMQKWHYTGINAHAAWQNQRSQVASQC